MKRPRRSSSLILLFALAGPAAALGGGCSTDLSAPDARVSVTSNNVAVGSTVLLDGSASSDPNGMSLAYRWQLSSAPTGSLANIEGADRANAWFVPDVSGDYLIELRVSDGSLTSAPATVTLTAGPCGGNTPTLTNIAWNPPKPNAGDMVVLASDANDADLDPACDVGEQLSYRWSLVEAPPDSRAVITGDALAHPTFIADAAGSYTVELVVTDRAGHSSPPLDQTLEVGGCGAPLGRVSSISAAPAAPAVGQPITLSAGVEALVPPAVPDAGTSGGSDAGTSDATADVASDAVSDAGGEAASDGSGSGAGSGDAASDAASDASGSDGGTTTCTTAPHFTYHWTLVAAPPGSAVTLVDSPLVSPWFTPDLPGDYGVELYVTNDRDERSASKSLTVSVGACGSNAPVIAAVTALPSAPLRGATVSLSGTVTDADTSPPCNLSDLSTLTWTLTSAPAGSQAAISDAHQTSPWFAADVAGTYLVEVRATDPSGRASAAQFVTVTAADCGTASPVIGTTTTTPASPDVGDVVKVTATASDSDTGSNCGRPEKLTFGWTLTAAPTGSAATLLDQGGTFTRFAPDVAGAYSLSLLVADSEGHTSAAKTVNVNVGAASTCGNAVPVARLAAFASGACAAACTPATIAPVPPANPAANPPNYTVVLNGHGSARFDASGSTDADNTAPCSAKQALSYLWTISSAPVGSSATWAIGSGASTTMTAPTLVPDLKGVYLVTLVVSDGTHTSAPVAIQITN